MVPVPISTALLIKFPVTVINPLFTNEPAEWLMFPAPVINPDGDKEVKPVVVRVRPDETETVPEMEKLVLIVRE